ncbi:MAG: ATP-binding protein [Spirochaetales bacterium]|nr:ATP-binding protein [Spirochaetales bacterium]
MLLEFSTENYKSFKDKVTFSMIPAPKQKGLDYSILHKKIDKKEYKALSAAVVYGPNASGKTNIIGAMQTLRNIILRGNINNSKVSSLNISDNILELIPNNTQKESQPVAFSIQFITNNKLFSYYLLLDLGKFMDREYDRSILEEVLTINNKTVFKRTKNSLESFRLDFIKDEISQAAKQNQAISQKIAQDSLDKRELFLSNGFKNIISSKLYSEIIEYFSNQFLTFYHLEQINTVPQFNEDLLINDPLNRAVKEFGINSNQLVYKKRNNNQLPVLFSFFQNSEPVPAEFFESYGTLRFVNIFPIIAKALQVGATVILDEFDASIHPMAIMSLISIFHNDEINIHNAQLIFNTHNPLYLNNNVFRRDEIKFIDRDDNTQCSRHYSLSDFGTKGTNARKDKDYMNNYFVNEYGAIRDIDFTDIFKKIIEEK